VISVWVVAEMGGFAVAPPAGLVALVMVSRSRIRARDWARAHPPRHARPKPPSGRTRPDRASGGTAASRREQYMLPAGGGGQQDGRQAPAPGR
jgi:hypothetical protein